MSDKWLLEEHKELLTIEIAKMQFFSLEWYTLLQSVIAASIETLMSDFDYCEVTIVCNTFDNIGSIIGFFIPNLNSLPWIPVCL